MSTVIVLILLYGSFLLVQFLNWNTIWFYASIPFTIIYVIANFFILPNRPDLLDKPSIFNIGKYQIAINNISNLIILLLPFMKIYEYKVIDNTSMSEISVIYWTLFALMCLSSIIVRITTKKLSD
ncbi:hypothetical protein [Winogradskyella psychrotolerans]|uniref:hypothetical protein n=1 Tax=Winogradskyella psychrotolerans TaxID=1344585 RepID=UPI001C06D09B|nr:hypothetical protein [Winogradskyella psychrotolerans]MBU2930236.1 hypothetical protein [Winogradskyella psychrotolerans]